MSKKYEYRGFEILYFENEDIPKPYYVNGRHFHHLPFAKEHVDNIYQKLKAYRDDEGVWRWKSNDNVPFDDMLECWNLSEEVMKKCAEARDADNKEFLKGYRERMKNHVPSDEEMFEMRAAFGEGETVVNVITGKKYKL